MTILVETKNGIILPMQVIKEYPGHGVKLCFAQDRIVLCDSDHHEITNIDVFDIIDGMVKMKVSSVKNQDVPFNTPVMKLTDPCIQCQSKSAVFWQNGFPFCSDECMNVFVNTPDPNDHYIDINERFDTLSDED